MSEQPRDDHGRWSSTDAQQGAHSAHVNAIPPGLGQQSRITSFSRKGAPDKSGVRTSNAAERIAIQKAQDARMGRRSTPGAVGLPPRPRGS